MTLRNAAAPALVRPCARAYHLHRARSTRLVRPGQLIVLDPSAPHSGSPAERGAWTGRLLVIELLGPNAALSGEDIPLGSRIIAVAHAFDSLPNSQEAPQDSHQHILSILKRGAGRQFDPDLTEIAARLLR